MAIRSIINFNDALHLAIGVNVIFLPEGDKKITYCILKKKKDIITIERKEEVQTIDELFAVLEPLLCKGVRVHVNCVGRSILEKIIPRQHNNDYSNQINQWFPGIRKEDFIYQRFYLPNAIAVSLIRGEDVSKAKLLLNNYMTRFSIGVCVMDVVAPLLQSKSISVEGYHLQFDSQQMIAMETSGAPSLSEFTIAGEQIEGRYILAYASALSLLLPLRDHFVEGLPPIINQAPDRYLAKKQIYQTARWVAIVLLLALLINAFLFLWLDQKVTTLEASVAFQKSRNKDSEQSRDITQRLFKAYDAIGWKTNRLPLIYADQIASTVPTDVRLNVMEEGVLDESVLRRDRKYQFDPTRIRLSGISNDPAALNDWVTLLRQYKWIEDIRDQKYTFDKHLSKGVFEFTILIKK
jgi:Tfp pilus assembly protein PilN